LNNRKNFLNNNGYEGKMFLNQDERVINVGLFTQVLFPVAMKIDIAASIAMIKRIFRLLILSLITEYE